ncbi:hypothetical protein K435DRAFT_228651 [Dendrothele bispora CBS 962.96]|uniref:Uncharacterized protein n=1 Tax=Dendrothele bispora (strain CBS 962.96) TaxID=1314807 RepID=A0A4S8LRQ6_DENBC|nr:hypothetical protein K435DRAFT_228651 [Dendrothele bispora CBS 962.96]
MSLSYPNLLVALVPVTTILQFLPTPPPPPPNPKTSQSPPLADLQLPVQVPKKHHPLPGAVTQTQLQVLPSSPSTVLGIKSIEGPYSSTLTPFSSPVFDNDENNDNNNDIVTYDCRSRPRLSLNPRLIRRFRPNSVPIPSSSSSPSPSSPSPSPSSPSFPTSNRHRFSTPTTFCSHYRKTDHDHMTTTTIENGKETQGQGERCTATKGSRMSRMGRKFWNETKRVLSGMS